MTELKLTEQEVKIASYLQNNNNKEIAWEELAQFAKNPQTVKKVTIQRVVSEIKRKYSQAGLHPPFSVTFKSLPVAAPPIRIDGEPIKEPSRPANIELDTGHSKRLAEVFGLNKPEQKLIKIPRLEPKPHQAQLDFALDMMTKRVKTKYGYKILNDPEWDVFKYIHANPGRIISINELRDKVVYPQYGSKLPARWYDSIMRIINNLRRQVDGLKSRLVTIGAFNSGETGYIFQ